jgi:hypothetical protein
MLENSFFNIKPRKPANIIITKKKFVIGLIIFMMLFATLKTYVNGTLRGELFSTKMYLALATIKDLNKTEDFNNAFTKGDFCGWKIVYQNGTESASQEFNKGTGNGTMFEHDITQDGITNKLTICIDHLGKFSESAKRQVFGIFVLTGLLIFMLYNTKFAEEDEQPEERNASPEKIQNT